MPIIHVHVREYGTLRRKSTFYRCVPTGLMPNCILTYDPVHNTHTHSMTQSSHQDIPEEFPKLPGLILSMVKGKQAPCTASLKAPMSSRHLLQKDNCGGFPTPSFVVPQILQDHALHRKKVLLPCHWNSLECQFTHKSHTTLATN